MEQQIASNLRRIEEGIKQHAQGREVRLICVTKYAEDDWVRALLRAGATDLGENRLPKAAERFAQLRAEGFSFNRHLIGAQQSRKLKLLPDSFDLFQAVDRLKTAEVLETHLADRAQELEGLLQVNVGKEEQKHGVDPAEALEVFHRIRENCSHLKLRGLMAVPPGPAAYADASEFERGTRRCFMQMEELFAKIAGITSGEPLVDTLSLGMSLDYLWAIEAGATMVRVGSALYEGLEG